MNVPFPTPRPTLSTISIAALGILQAHTNAAFPFADNNCKPPAMALNGLQNGRLPLTYEAGQMKLEKLVADGVFQVGEAFTCSDGGGQVVLVISQIRGSKLHLRHVAPGGQVVDFVGREVNGPVNICKSAFTKIMGRAVNGKAGWESVTCVRNGQVKSLKVMRAEHYDACYYQV